MTPKPITLATVWIRKGRKMTFSDTFQGQRRSVGVGLFKTARQGYGRWRGQE